MQIDKKNFLITGGASGLGFATAQTIVNNGGNAVLLDLNEEAGNKAQQSLGNKSLFVKTDVVKEDDVKNAIAKAKSAFGNIHGIINCAGVGHAKRVVGKEGAQPLDFFNKVVQINLIGTFNTIRLVANEMQHNTPEASGERGIVINTASVAAFDGQIGQAAYSASKGGSVMATIPPLEAE